MDFSLERSGVTSLRDISIVGSHVTRCYDDETIWPPRVELPRKSVLRRAPGGMRVVRCYARPLWVRRPWRGYTYRELRITAVLHCSNTPREQELRYGLVSYQLRWEVLVSITHSCEIWTSNVCHSSHISVIINHYFRNWFCWGDWL
jgi:hypothetical protein